MLIKNFVFDFKRLYNYDGMVVVVVLGAKNGFKGDSLCRKCGHILNCYETVLICLVFLQVLVVPLQSWDHKYLLSLRRLHRMVQPIASSWIKID